MTTCHTELITDYLDERLSPQDESALERHLETCADCRNTIAETAGSDADWTAVPAALRSDEFDSNEAPETLNWPLTLLGPTDDPRMLGRIGPI